ncbi:hypothetical protein C8J57DRAFT_1650715 [Mycena rebaudengoi]|nr:hypothetical protein C8J57DRAFT_1650715 [Mycena rebaudengoi]
MSTTAKLKNLIQYTILAATTVQTIAETAKVPFFVSTSALCLSITKCIETTKLNKEECAEIMEHIHEILCIIVQLHSNSEIKGVLPTAVLYDIAKFTEALEKLFTVLNGQQKGTLGKIKGLFRQLEAVERLDKFKQELSRMVQLFKAQVTGLGAGGMGKTSLARAALHNLQVEAKYTQRYFVPCHSSPTCTELTATIADHVGLEKGSNMAKQIAHYFAHAPPSLLVLDNLETCWESLTCHSEVEEFLSLLTDVSHLALIITMRGAERPNKTFIDLADDGHDDASIKELLELTGNLPLAVSLIASVANSEGCAQALSRWKLERTQMLSEGYDQRSSLDISIMLSYTSPRMTPGAQELLSILSMLPDGLTDADLVQAKLPIIDILACKTTLIQTSLAFVDRDQHLKLLVPIREHLLHVHPPAIPLKIKLREHFHQILDLWNQFKNFNVGDILPQMSQNLGNFNTVLHDGLEPEGPDIVQNFRSILCLNDFYSQVHNTHSPLLLQLFGYMQHWKSNPIFGEYLIELLESSDFLPDMDFDRHITLGTQYFKLKEPLEQARWSRALGLYFRGAKFDFVEALKCYQKAYSLAKSIGYPTLVGHQALRNICQILLATGRPLSALTHAKEAYRYAEHIGDIYEQAHTLYFQARCHTAEIHLVKSEYLQSRNLQVENASNCHPASYHAILANINIALIDLATGVDSKNVCQNLDNCKFYLKALYGFSAKAISLIADLVAAELCLRDGALGTANAMFEKCFALSQNIAIELRLFCLERLGDLSMKMNDIQTTLQWIGIFLGLALACKDKYQTMQAFQCLGQIFSAKGDDETALSLFSVALDGFTFMDVHHWRADCMVRIAGIMNNCGEVMKAVELWKVARPLFERSSQMKDITKIDAKLAEVDSAVLVEYEEQLQRLSEFHVPGSAPEETDIVEDEEKEEEDKLAEENDFGDKGKQGVLL